MTYHINGGNPEHNCPETGDPAWCFHAGCEVETCKGAKRQDIEFELAFSGERNRAKLRSRVKAMASAPSSPKTVTSAAGHAIARTRSIATASSIPSKRFLTTPSQ